jgi:hypothetical protein
LVRRVLRFFFKKSSSTRYRCDNERKLTEIYFTFPAAAHDLVDHAMQNWAATK